MEPTAGTETAYITQYAEATLPTLSSYQWEFIAAPVTGYHSIVNRYTGKTIQPTDGSTAENTNLSQTTLVASPYNTELQWAIESSDETNYYWIKTGNPVCTSVLLEVQMVQVSKLFKIQLTPLIPLLNGPWQILLQKRLPPPRNCYSFRNNNWRRSEFNNYL